MKKTLFLKKHKYYGRLNINKLDLMFAAGWVLLALGTIWLAIGLSIRRAGLATFPAFRDFANGITFNYFLEGQLDGIAIVNGILFYGALAYLLLSTAFLILKNNKDRLPGVFATYFSLVGGAVLFSLFYEFGFGASKGVIPAIWPFGEVVFLVLLFAFCSISIFATFSSYDIELKGKEGKEKQPEPETKPEPEPEPKPEPNKELEVEEEPELDEGEEGEIGFSKFGPRRRKIPFESKLKKADHDTFERYDSIVKAIRAYDVNDRISIPGETFSYKREKIVFLTFAGKTLKVYFALDPKSFKDSAIPVRDVSDVKKFEQTPCMLVIKSNLAARRAILLARTAFMRHDVPRKK